MAWLRLTHRDGIKCLVNTDQVSEIYVCSGAYRPTSAIRMDDGLIAIEETVDEIAAMIELAERRDRVDGIFRAIVYNFPQGYDPAEIWKTAWRLMDALDKSREL